MKVAWWYHPGVWYSLLFKQPAGPGPFGCTKERTVLLSWGCRTPMRGPSAHCIQPSLQGGLVRPVSRIELTHGKASEDRCWAL